MRSRSWPVIKFDFCPSTLAGNYHTRDIGCCNRLCPDHGSRRLCRSAAPLRAAPPQHSPPSLRPPHLPKRPPAIWERGPVARPFRVKRRVEQHTVGSSTVEQSKAEHSRAEQSGAVTAVTGTMLSSQPVFSHAGHHRAIVSSNKEHERVAARVCLKHQHHGCTNMSYSNSNTVLYGTAIGSFATV